MLSPITTEFATLVLLPLLNVPPRPCSVPPSTSTAGPGVAEDLRKFTLSKITPEEPPRIVSIATAASDTPPLASTFASTIVSCDGCAGVPPLTVNASPLAATT